MSQTARRRGRRPVTSRPHGTRARYLRGPDEHSASGKGCRCQKCSAAHYAYMVSRLRVIVRGTWDPYTDAAPVREHIGNLIAAGLTEKNVTDLAGVPPGTVYRIMHNEGRRVRHESARAILAVRPSDLARLASGMVEGCGTVRRLGALVACGWTQELLAAGLGVKSTNLSAIMRGFRGQERVRASTAHAVRELYDRLWDQPPPQETPRQRANCRRARQIAAERGWVVPAAWDDDRIDNPDASPAAGWQRSRRLSLADRAEEAREAIRLEGSRRLAAERLGMSEGALETTLSRDRRRAS